LFSAVWPSETALAHLATAVGRVELPAGARPVPPEKWHLTLAFYGNDASPQERAEHLDEQVAGLAAPELRLAGAGTFGGVLWVGVEGATPRDGAALDALAAAAGAGETFRPHVTVARWRQHRPRRRLAEQLAGYRGPAWTVSQVSLVRSGLGAGYTTVHRVALASW
jgi:2'-5' RNA ligase